MIILVGALKKASVNSLPSTPDMEIGLVKNLGTVLFNDFALPFEVSSILFLAAMVGAVMLGKKEIK
jgi:NADH-quinone oxidoreductase subunit J